MVERENDAVAQLSAWPRLISIGGILGGAEALVPKLGQKLVGHPGAPVSADQAGFARAP